MTYLSREQEKELLIQVLELTGEVEYLIDYFNSGQYKTLNFNEIREKIHLLSQKLDQLENVDTLLSGMRKKNEYL